MKFSLAQLVRGDLPVDALVRELKKPAPPPQPKDKPQPPYREPGREPAPSHQCDKHPPTSQLADLWCTHCGVFKHHGVALSLPRIAVGHEDVARIIAAFAPAPSPYATPRADAILPIGSGPCVIPPRSIYQLAADYVPEPFLPKSIVVATDSVPGEVYLASVRVNSYMCFGFDTGIGVEAFAACQACATAGRPATTNALADIDIPLIIPGTMVIMRFENRAEVARSVSAYIVGHYVTVHAANEYFKQNVNG